MYDKASWEDFALNPPLAPKREHPHARLVRLLAFDEGFRHGLEPNTVLVGCDEVGRGSLIGSVVAAAVAWKRPPSAEDLDALSLLVGLNDSKKLTAQQRQALRPAILAHCHVGIGQASPEEIETLNILGASMLSVQRAIEGLQLCLPDAERTPCHYLMDGRESIPTVGSLEQRAIVKGDAHSALIAMASIVAKEHRDDWVRSVAGQFPAYAWERNMGYATVQHRQAIQRLGITPHHRPSFRVITKSLFS
jgi:ribonuclease HII